MNDWTKPVRQPYTGREIPAFLHGVITPMFTPCTPEHTLDEKGIRSYTDYLINMGSITTLFPRCGLGKMYQFTYDDVKNMIDWVIEAADGRAPVMPGTTGIWNKDKDRTAKPDPADFTREAIELSQYAQQKGATAVVQVMPEAVTPKDGVSLEDTIFTYFKTVAAEIDLPIIIYRPPGLSMDYEITPPLLNRMLNEIPNLAGMKYSTQEIVTIMRLAMAIPEGNNFGIISGDELAFLFTMPLGAVGVIGQGCNTNPEILRAVYDRMMAKDVEGATEAAKDSVRAVDVCNTIGGGPQKDEYNVDAPLSGLMYAARKGAGVQPFTLGDSKDISKARMDDYERDMDALRKPYLDAMK